ncbi:MAG: HAD-IIB family hydrolase [Erysipelotrichaceae bacterium]|nr:HAD-IIB family hydrolase [Erysipelotrichaceae bacterium]
MKTLFCDLDNTLLFQLENGTYGIKDKDLKALQKVLKGDVRLVIASGRPADINESISRMIGVEIDAVGHNGHQLISGDQNIIFASFPIEDYLKITDYIHETYPEYNTATTDFHGVYYVGNTNKPEPLTRFNNHKKAGIIKEVAQIPAHLAFEERGVKEVSKLLIRVPHETDSDPIIQNLHERFGDKYVFIRSNKMFIEGLVKGHTKRTGIESYIKMHNLDMKDCYAAGDADNDIEMFELLHENSFCMKAGSQRALDASHYHVEDLAEALEIINGRE